MTEIIAALKLIPELINAVKAISAGIEKLQDTITQKNLEDLRKEVNASLSQLKSAKSKDERAALIAAISKAMSK